LASIKLGEHVSSFVDRFAMSIPSRRYALPIGYVIECRGAWLRIRLGSVATVITVTGSLAGDNLEIVIAHLRRFTALQSPLVLSAGDATISGEETLACLIDVVGAECDQQRLDSVFVTGANEELCDRLGDAHPAVRAETLADAFEHLDSAARARRKMPAAWQILAQLHQG
jgi:hypothetical protein